MPAFWLMGHAVFAVLLAIVMIALTIVLFLYKTGRAGNDFLLFHPEGFDVGRARQGFRIAWTDIAQVRAGEISGNAATLLWFTDAAAVARSASDSSPQAFEKLAKQFTACRKWQGCDWYVLTALYGLDAVLLAKAIERYRSDPGTHAELAPQKSLA